MDKLYLERFLRNIGIMDESGLQKIRSTRIAIGGLGLGGSIFIDLVRLGFEKFHVADPDVYDRTNCNRQRMAKETTIGRRKDECLIEEARAINPAVEVRAFAEGVQAHNVGEFLKGIDWAVDVVDLFAMKEKLLLNEEARKRGIPVASCASAGFTGLVVVFDHEGPSFADLSGITNEQSFEENCRRFVKFILPEVPEYMAAQLEKAMNRSSHIPFVVAGVEVSAALAATSIARQVLGLGERIVAPEGQLLDPLNLKAERFEARWNRTRNQRKRAA